MFAWIKARVEPWSLLPLRLVVGLLFLAHAGQKLFVSGVPLFAGFLRQQGIEPAFVTAVVVIAVELLGGLGIVLGVLTRGAALLLTIDMAVVILALKWPQGFFASHGGFEFELTLLAACLTLVLAGAKRPSLDDRWSKQP